MGRPISADRQGATGRGAGRIHSAKGFSMVELLIVVTIIGVTVALSTFSVTIFDDFKVTERVNALLEQIVECRERAIFFGSVCTVHIENERTKREINETLLGRRVRVGGVEYKHHLVPYALKISETEDESFEILHYEQAADLELDITYARNIDPTGEKDPLLSQGVISYLPDASYTPFILKVDMSDVEEIVFIHGDGTKLPEFSAENPLLSY